MPDGDPHINDTPVAAGEGRGGGSGVGRRLLDNTLSQRDGLASHQKMMMQSRGRHDACVRLVQRRSAVANSPASRLGPVAAMRTSRHADVLEAALCVGVGGSEKLGMLLGRARSCRRHFDVYCEYLFHVIITK